MLGARRGDPRARVERRQARLGHVRAPRPRVAKPQRREHVQRRGVGPAVVRGHQHEDVVVAGLGVLDHDVEVAVLVEHAGVEQLVLGLLLAAAPVGGDEIPVGVRALRILVLALQVGVRRRTVEVEPVLLGVLTVVALAVGEPEHPLLEDGVGAVPQRECQTQPLTLVADPRDAVLAPAVGARPRLVVREVAPRVPAGAVVLAHRPPLALAQVRAPGLPRDLPRARFLEPAVLGRLGRRRRGLHERESGRRRAPRQGRPHPGRSGCQPVCHRPPRVAGPRARSFAPEPASAARA